MAGEVTHLDDSGEPEWAELEALLADFARLARSEAPFSRVARELLDRLVDTLAAVGAAVWLADDTESLRLERQVNIGVLGEGALTGDHRRLLIATMRAARTEALAPGQSGQAGANPTPYTLLLLPLVIDREAVGLVEVIQRPSIDPEALAGNQRFAALLAELAADHLRRREVRRLRSTVTGARRLDDFLHAIHLSLDPKETASHLANEGRRLIGCDRASVAIRRGRRHRLVAVSSVDSINRRSLAVRRLERLMARVAASGGPLWLDEGEQSLPPQIEDALAMHLDESHARSVGVVPLRAPPADKESQEGAIIGALVVEGFDARPWDETHETTDAVARHGGLALANALQHRWARALPFMRSRSAISGEPTRRVLKAAAILALVAAVASTFLIEMDYNLYAQGELRPAVRRHVFAPLDGQVTIVKASHGDVVNAGQALVELTSPELDLEIQQIQGEHDATLQRSMAIESALLDFRSATDPDGVRANQLAAEQAELRKLFASQQQRLAVLRAERERLVVRSPIAGEVLTWETDDQLLDRPVARGQRLMTVADLDGPWEAELRVPDDRVGPLLRLLKTSAGRVPATFEVATDRGDEHEGRIVRVARRTDLDEEHRAVVRVEVEVDKSSLEAPRPGATVYATIHCGRRSVFYVWCHDLVDRVQGWLRF